MDLVRVAREARTTSRPCSSSLLVYIFLLNIYYIVAISVNRLTDKSADMATL